MAAWVSTLLICLALVFVVVQSTVPTDDDTLVRCPRHMCTRMCHFGNVVDERGCPTCECEDDPCQVSPCKPDIKCIPVACADDCEKAWVARCDDDDSDEKSDSDSDSNSEEGEGMPCPMPMCATLCHFGYKKNERGCQTCGCADDPCETMTCPPEEVCMSHMGQPACMPSGMVPGRNPMMRSGMPPMAVDCPMVKCVQTCEFGYVLNERGCRTCMCNTSPCETHLCEVGYQCRSYHSDCEEASCQVMPICNVASLCQHHRDVAARRNAEIRDPSRQPTDPMFMEEETRSEAGVHIPACASDGSFSARQCHGRECWCVNDRGEEVMGSRGRPKDCVSLKTTSVHMTFFVEHDIDVEQITPHMDDLRSVIHRHVATWMMVDEQLVEVQDLQNQNRRIKVQILVLRGSADHDLASTAFNLHARVRQHACQFRFRQHKMLVNERDFRTEHHTGPLNFPMHTGGHHYYHSGNVYFLAAGAVILFVTAVVIIALRLRRRQFAVKLQRKHMNHWRKNLLESLSFPKQPYKEMDDSSEDIPPADTQAVPPKADESLA